MRKLFIGKLSYDLTTEQLRTAFSMQGKVVDAIVMVDKET